MPRILTSTWAPGPGWRTSVLEEGSFHLGAGAELSGEPLQERLLKNVRTAEELGIDYLLVACDRGAPARKSTVATTTVSR